ncbi:MAG: glutamine--fructose-6-phosphate transaminase (isomerizing), partial [Burkholderiales bacterium]|nr:glutamine--fructose-6-phosphate transaminase (isomerizing) [Burkholderiales bacterium]
MCGIVGAVAGRNIVPILIEGLKRLEYRGYDSCGIAVFNAGLKRARSVHRVQDLEAQIRETGFAGTTGISHTRWATHGAPVTANAHPHFSRDRIAIVHNGIIENYEDIRKELQAAGFVFESQTDTEVIAHLVNHLYAGDLLNAVQQAVKKLRGAYAIAVFCRDEPQRVVAARFGSPLVVGLGDGENFVASDAMALAGTTDRIIYLEEGDVVDVQQAGVRVYGRDDERVEREARIVKAHTGAAELGPYRHFMQKEIFEQPRAIADTLEGVDAITPMLFGEGAEKVFTRIDSLLILACGTSYYAGLTAKYWLEAIAKLPTQVEIASEYRYRETVPDPDSLVVVISQSGETADTLAALKHAQALGMNETLAICNLATSAMVRLTKLNYLTRAGVEIGVASTKAFTTQLAALFLLTLALAKLRGRLPADAEAAALR